MSQAYPSPPPETSSEPEQQPRFDLKQVAAVAFVMGVLLHACVIMTVLGDGSGSGAGGLPTVEVTPAAPAAGPPRPTPLQDRSSCSEIRGTDYRSEAERRWFLANCT